MILNPAEFLPQHMHRACCNLNIFTWSAWMSIMKAFLLQDMSCSPSKNLAISSGASGIRESWFLFIINKCHNLLTWNYAIILTQTQYTFILIKKQTSHDWDGDHLKGDGDYLKGPWLNEGHWDIKHSEDLALTLTCDLELQFKINAHPFTKGTL